MLHFEHISHEMSQEVLMISSNSHKEAKCNVNVSYSLTQLGQLSQLLAHLLLARSTKGLLYLLNYYLLNLRSLFKPEEK